MEINTLETNNRTIREANTPINLFKTQIIIKKISSGSLRIKNISIFKNKRKTIYIKELDRESAIMILKNHFCPNKLNAMLIDDEFYNSLKMVYEEHFSNNKAFKIKRCNKLLEDIENENTLTELIRKEHLDKNDRGIQATFEDLKRHIYNPRLKLRINQFINNCEICTLEKYDRNPPKIRFKISETASKPLEIIHVDVFYTLKKQLFMTMIDKFTKHATAYKIYGRTWTEFKTKILQYISTYGKMEKIVADNELGFKAIPMQQFLKDEKIDIHFTSNSNHTSNADIERLHNTINEHLRLLRHDEKNKDETVEEKMLRIIAFYNKTIHSTTKIKPIDFLNGKIHEEKYNEIRNTTLKQKEKYIEKMNKGRTDVELTEGTNFIKEIRGGKNHRKYRKINTRKLDDEHLENTKTGHKYYKTHIRQKKKYQEAERPTIKAKN